MVRLVFLGSPAFAVPSVEAVQAAGHEVSLVVTQPDRPAGRGQKRTPPPVAAYAREHSLPLWQTSSLRGPEAEERLRAAAADAMVLAAFAALVPGNILQLTPGGILNVHPSLLPRWRGAAPIQAALRAGDTETGVSIIRLVAALDAGPIFVQECVPIAPEDDYLSLEPRLAALGAQLLVRTLADRPTPWPQDDTAATFAPRIDREDARIDWSQPAQLIWNQIRAYRAWPQAFTTFDGRQLKVLRARPLDAQGVLSPMAGDVSPQAESESPGSSPPSPPIATPRREDIADSSTASAQSPAPRQRGGPSAWPAAPAPSPAPPRREDIAFSSAAALRAGTVLIVAGLPVVVTGSGLLRLDEIQLEGKRAQSGAEFLRGYPRLVGAVLGAAMA